MCIFKRHKNWVHIGGKFWFYISLSLVSAGIFGELKIHIYQAIPENCFVHYFLILKPFLPFCLLNYLIVLNKTFNLEGNKWIQISSLTSVWIFIKFSSWYGYKLKIYHNIWPVFLLEFLISMLNVNFWPFVVPWIISSSVFFQLNSFKLKVSLTLLFLPIHIYLHLSGFIIM